MSANNNAIQALVNMGADAQKNMFDTWIKFPWDEEETIVSTRAEGFNIPKAETATDDRKYHGSSMKTPTSEITFERTFTLTFRLDASYALYQQFVSWHETTGDPVNGGVSNWMNATGTVKVKQLSGTYAATGVGDYIDGTDYTITGDNNALWTFYDVWVGGVGQPSFSNDSSGHITYEVTFYFADTDYPFYNSAGISGTGSGGAISAS